jgi:HSP20 family protein
MCRPRIRWNKEVDMGNMIRFDPFVDTFPDVFRNWAAPMRNNELAFDFKVDVSETENEYRVKADIPGLKKEDIHVDIDGNIVSISAETKRETENKGEKWLRTERHYGKVQRSFSLGQDVDSVAAKAKYDQGVLNLVLPKKVGALSKQITVQ